jgi:hypothetical protein
VGSFPGADVFVLRNIHQIRTKNPDVASPLANGIIESAMAAVTYLRSEPRRKIFMAPGSPAGSLLRGHGRHCVVAGPS